MRWITHPLPGEVARELFAGGLSYGAVTGPGRRTRPARFTGHYGPAAGKASLRHRESGCRSGPGAPGPRPGHRLHCRPSLGGGPQVAVAGAAWPYPQRAAGTHGPLTRRAAPGDEPGRAHPQRSCGELRDSTPGRLDTECNHISCGSSKMHEKEWQGAKVPRRPSAAAGRQRWRRCRAPPGRQRGTDARSAYRYYRPARVKTPCVLCACPAATGGGGRRWRRLGRPAGRCGR